MRVDAMTIITEILIMSRIINGDSIIKETAMFIF